MSFSCPTSFWLQPRRGALLLGLLLGFSGAGAAELTPIVATAIPVAVVNPPPATESEYLVMAKYLRKFTRYVEWPAGSFANASDPIVIGVLGTNPFGTLLEDHVHDYNAGGRTPDARRVEVRLVKTVEEAARCHVVFIASWQKRDEAVWLRALHGKAVLTVTESEQGLAQGAVLAFVFERVSGRSVLRFDTNRQAAQEAGLQIRAEMLQMTRKFYHEPVKPKDEP